MFPARGSSGPLTFREARSGDLQAKDAEGLAPVLREPGNRLVGIAYRAFALEPVLLEERVALAELQANSGNSGEALRHGDEAIKRSNKGRASASAKSQRWSRCRLARPGDDVIIGAKALPDNYRAAHAKPGLLF